MEEKKKVTLSELKVGIFVIVASAILAVAIFTIGSQVGLLEETFAAKTYLNNVSGLKPGDIVLLGGVEVGNVTSVHISAPDEMPQTQENREKLAEIERLQQRLGVLELQVQGAAQRVDDARDAYQAALQQSGTGDAVERLARELEERQQEAETARRDLGRLQERIERAQQGLQNIVIYMQIKSEYRDWVRQDSQISLGSVGLLGDKYIEISLGRSLQQPLVVDEEVEGVFGDTTRKVVLITGRTQTGFQELITGANDILANFESLSDTLDDILYKFEQGEGTIGKFFNDDSFYNNLNDTVLEAKSAASNASRLMNDVSSGEGTIGRLIRDSEMYDRISDSADRLRTLATDIQEGKGTLGRFVNDEALYDNANQTMENIRDLTAGIEAGEGTLGLLAKDEKLYQDMKRTLDQLASFVEGIDQGEGTLGRLAKDEQLYQNINEVSSEVVKLIYDFRQNPRKFLTIKFELF